jgi:hypothetical protein
MGKSKKVKFSDPLDEVFSKGFAPVLTKLTDDGFSYGAIKGTNLARNIATVLSAVEAEDKSEKYTLKTLQSVENVLKAMLGNGGFREFRDVKLAYDLLERFLSCLESEEGEAEEDGE